MASYELSAFDRFNAITVVGAIEQQTPATLNVGFWVRDPNQFLIYPDQVSAHPRLDFFWDAGYTRSFFKSGIFNGGFIYP